MGTTSLTFTVVIALGALWLPICHFAWHIDYKDNEDKENKHENTYTY